MTARPPEPDALPIVLNHGWPGSVVEFTEVMGQLADPVTYGGDAGDAFHVGHFAAFEVPERFVDDVRSFARRMR